MHKILFIFLVLSPYFLMAQKGIIKPDLKPQGTAVSLPDDVKIWQVDDKLVNCLDSNKRCYVVKENSVNKTVFADDVYGFFYEEGNKYTITVKQVLKTPPVSTFAGIYIYRLVKIISKKAVTAEIPVVTKEEIQNAAIGTPGQTIKVTSIEEILSNDIFDLKKQIRDLKKQVEIMQLQMNMQLKMMDKR